VNHSRFVVYVFVGALLCAPAANAATTRRVCASGCTYTDPQAAIDAAVPGDTILLRAGETFIGHFILRNKTGTAQILIRSDAPDSDLPAAGVRLVPANRPGGTTPLSKLARLRGKGGTWRTTPLIRTENGAHNYRLQFLDIDGIAQEGYETLMALGNNTSQTTTSLAPRALVLDRLYVHGDPARGQKRCLALDSASTDILNSYFVDCKHFAEDSQAIAGFNGPGPFRIENNYLEASTENIMFGGSDPKTPNLVPSDIVIRRNTITKSLAWKNPAITPPSGLSAVASSATGSLSAGTHYFKVEAVLVSSGSFAFSVPSAEKAATLASSGKAVALSWNAVTGATRYRVYRGSTSGGENVWIETSGPATSVTYTGQSEHSGTPHTTATRWNVKNLIELKNAQRVTIEGNTLEYVWKASQNGYAFVLTPRNQGNTAPWTAVRDVTIRYNTVRHANGGVSILGIDYSASTGSQRTTNIKIQHNVFDDIGAAWGGGAFFMVITSSPTNITLDHNTVFHDNNIVTIDNGASSGFVYTNNLSKHNTYGIFGSGSATGNATLSLYFPGAIVRRNVFAGGNGLLYPLDNFFPSVTTFWAQFVNYAARDYRLVSTSPYLKAGTDGLDIGADIATLKAVQQGTAGSTPTNAPPTASTGGPYTAKAGQALTVNGSGSRDTDGSITAYRWTWGDGTSDGSGATTSHTYAQTGTFTLKLTVTDNGGATASATTSVTVNTATTTGPGDIVLTSADVNVIRGAWAKVSTTGSAGGQALKSTEQGLLNTIALAKPTHYFEATFKPAANTAYHVWLRIKAPSKSDDSVWVQFTGGVDAAGAALWRTGTANALLVNLENCSGCGVSGWGWQDGAFWIASPSVVKFRSGSPQTARVQIREDGITIDQIVLSPVQYFTASPGPPTNDSTIFTRTGTILSAGNIVLRAGDVVTKQGNWTVEIDPNAAGGSKLVTPDVSWSSTAAPLASPPNYVELSFSAVAGVRYRAWFRMAATGNLKSNDSFWAQYDQAVDMGGTATTRIGTTSGVLLNRQPCSECVMSGWGWFDRAWWTQAGYVTFATTGVQTIRIQTREDGVRFDQVVISPSQYASVAPGATNSDSTIVPP
jgi:hypothetical protein